MNQPPQHPPLFQRNDTEYRAVDGMAVEIIEPSGRRVYKPAVQFKLDDDGAYWQWLRCLREGKVNLPRR